MESKENGRKKTKPELEADFYSTQRQLFDNKG